MSDFEQGDRNTISYRNDASDNPSVADDNPTITEGIELAIIGMAGRFPGARNLEEFWKNLSEGIESISTFTDDEVLATGVDPALVKTPHYVKAGGVLQGVEEFDATFFGFYPREAAILDPQHRIFLEVAWEALENAGYNPEAYNGYIGLFAGCGMNTYLIYNLIPNREISETVHGYQLTIANDKDFLPTRVSYKFNLRGPSVNVQTACSTSLVAVHLACQSLLSYQSDMALAGGVTIRLPQKQGYLYQEGGIASPDGHCRAFDAKAGGTVGGNGAGVVVLKRLEDALRDGDTINAIIKGSAINNDGSLKVGYTAPSVEGQSDVIATAQAIANVDPATISYIETHGTGTSLGDPIEIAALTQVFRSNTAKKGYCAIGSVKTNIGHLDAAAGVTSLIKTVLALEHKQIPPSLNFQEPNPKIDFENSPFFVNTKLSEWVPIPLDKELRPADEGDHGGDWASRGLSTTGLSTTPELGSTRRAGVSSFGIGGTNAHVVLEEAPILESSGSSRYWQPLMLSAASQPALEKATDNLVQYLIDNPSLNLADVAYTLQVGRKRFNHRRVLVCHETKTERPLEEAIQALETRDPLHTYSNALNTVIPEEKRLSTAEGTVPRAPSIQSSSARYTGVEFNRALVFMFTGQGAQYINMGRDLYKTEPVFREQIDLCARILYPVMGLDIRQVIYSDEMGVDDEGSPSAKAASERLMQTDLTQPALFAVEYALAKLLMYWGLIPEAMIGHSIGEYVAACLAGVFSLEDALKIVAERGRLMHSQPAGGMVSIPLGEDEVRAFLKETNFECPSLALAAINSPNLCVISGPSEEIDKLTFRLANEGVEYRRLRTSHAFHSPMMDPIVGEFEQKVSQIMRVSTTGFNPPKIPFISNLTGAWISVELANDPSYWARHLRQTVRFADGVAELLKDPAWILVEVGPGQTLTTLAKSAFGHSMMSDDRTILSTIRPPRNRQDDQAFLLTTLGRLWLAGIEMDWNAYYSGERRYRVALPSYPFERQRYWVVPDFPIGQIAYLDDSAVEYSRVEHDRTRIGAREKPRRSELRKIANLDEWIYSVSWKRSDLFPPAIEVPDSSEGACWLLLAVEYNRTPTTDAGVEILGERIVSLISDRLRESGQPFVIVRPGERFEQIEQGVYLLNPQQQQHYHSLLDELSAQGLTPKNIIHFWNLSRPGGQSFSDLSRQWQSFYSLLFLAQALASQAANLSKPETGGVYQQAPDDRSVQIGILTCSVLDVTGEEELDPDQATLLGLSKVISQEHPELDCRIIDLAVSRPVAEGRLSGLVEKLLVEFTASSPDRTIAYRGSHRWTPVYEQLRMVDGLGGRVQRDELHRSGPDVAVEDNPAELPALLRQAGVYLITGGLGRIGWAMAEYLASKVQARLVLLDRNAFPAGETPLEWEIWLAKHGENEPTSQKVRKLQALAALGAEVMLIQADVSDLSQMQEAIRRAEARFGSINGVIHAAGIVGEQALKFLEDTTVEDCHAHFQAKLVGAQVLGRIMADRAVEFNRAIEYNRAVESNPPDFIFLQSSLSAVLGGLGFGAYAAANAYLDVFAAFMNQNGGTPWICINWDGWSFDTPLLLTSEAGRAEVPIGAELSMTPEEGLQIFERILSLNRRSPFAYEAVEYNQRNLIISTADLDARLDRWVRVPRGAGRLSELPGVSDEGESGQLGGEWEPGGYRAPDKRSARFPRPRLQTPYVAPRDELENTIVQVWERILGIEPVGVYDDFFELGGHSLLATQLVTRLRDAYKVDLPLRRLFETPTIAGLAQLMRDSGESGAAITGQIKKSQDLALSYGQQRLWFLDQLEPGSSLYNNFAAIRLSGRLVVEGLEFGLHNIVRRHDILRTNFREAGGKPVQIIAPHLDIEIAHIDISEVDAVEREQELMRLAIEESRRPFSLADGALFRVTLVRLGQNDHVLFLTMHHIISDGWSVRVLISEIGAFYAAYLDGDDSDILPDLPVQYADFAAWQREWILSEILEEQLSYWRKQLAIRYLQQGVYGIYTEGSSGNVELYPDRPRPSMQTSHGATQWFELPDDLSRELVSLSNHEGVTLFMTLLAALQTLIYRYTGQVDVSVGTPVANRSRAETEGLIGFILNTLVMRTDLSGDPSFRELLDRVRQVALGAYAHQDLPFEMLVEALQPQRDLSRSPFFQIIFDLQEAALPALELPGLKATPIQVDSGTAKFDLALSVEYNRLYSNAAIEDARAEPNTDMLGRANKLSGFFNYNSDLFDRETILRLIGHWQTLLAGIVADPSRRLSQLPLLTEVEERQLTVEWNAAMDKISSPVTYPALIHQRFSAQAQRSPLNNALVLDDISMSFIELERHSNQLANHLIKLGVGPEILVGVCLERTIDVVVAFLGVLKAGGAFLPLDPSYPKDRLAYMIRDSHTQIIITHEDLLPTLAQIDEVYPVVIGNAEQLGESDLEPDIAIDAKNMVYVIYTSGSTGEPKGVVVEHQAFADHCRVISRHFGIKEGDRVLQFSSYNFDAALEQIFTALISGATLYLRGNEIWTAEEFERKIAQYDLTEVNVPPAYWHQWVQHVAVKYNLTQIDPARIQGWEDQPNRSLKLGIVGGDVLLPESLELWQQTPMRSVRLLNAYGPTESIITAATHEVVFESKPFSTMGGFSRIPIGRPCGDRKFYLLDQNGALVPIGVPGELFIGGKMLARGYLNRPELTAERFVPNPFVELHGGSIDSERLYRTGDLVRRLPDGNIDFLGRFDTQVKLRGFRVELGEIEAALNAHPLVRESVVLLRGRADESAGSRGQEVEYNREISENRHLVAYVVVDQPTRLSSSDLQDYLREILPTYMLPSTYVFLDVLPLTPSGKLDRRALPEPDGERPDLHSQYIAPRTPVEIELAHLWSQLLGLDWDEIRSPVGVHDNFFELGGHSLLATQIISRLRELYQVELPVRQFFEQPTIEGLAEAITLSLVKEEDQAELDAILGELEGMADEDVRLLLEENNALSTSALRTTGLSTTGSIEEDGG